MKLNNLILAGLTAMALSACDESFNDWAQPATNAQDALVTLTNGSVSAVGVIDFATVTDSYVKVCNINAPTSSLATTLNSYTIAMGGNVFDLLPDGTMLASDLEAYTMSTFGRRPVENTITAQVTAFTGSSDTKTRFDLGNVAIIVKPQAPEIEQSYYLTGSINNWDNTNTTYELTNDGSDPYANPTFTCRIPAPEDGSNVEFKFTPKSGLGGDWSKCLAAGDADGKFVYNNAGGNLVIQATPGAKYYDMTFNMLDGTWSYKAVSFNPFIYFIGATDGWQASDQKLALTADGIYTGYCYVADPNGWGLAFKFQRQAGSWDDEINANTFTTKNGVSGDNNIEVAEAGVYYFTVNLIENSITAMKVNNMNLVGDFNGWNAADDAQQMTWDADNFCYVITGAGVTANGWKFTTNNSWDVNLGGDSLDNLVANGSNISAVGTTIKLYPTRKTSDNIFCTVE